MACGGHIDNGKIALSHKLFRPILTKFCTITDIIPSEITRCSNNEFKKYNMADGCQFERC